MPVSMLNTPKKDHKPTTTATISPGLLSRRSLLGTNCRVAATKHASDALGTQAACPLPHFLRGLTRYGLPRRSQGEIPAELLMERRF
jgi:hypothetical protein